MTEIQSLWECPHCLELHAMERHAEWCCTYEVKEVWLCPVCEERHYDEDAAKKCCVDSDE